MSGICKQHSILYKGLEHPQILVFEEGPGTKLLRRLRDNGILYCLP